MNETIKEEEEIKYLKENNEYSKLFYNRQQFEYLKKRYPTIEEFNEVKFSFTHFQHKLTGNHLPIVLKYLNDNPIVTNQIKEYLVDIFKNSGVISYDESIRIFNLLKQKESIPSIRYFSAAYFIIYHQHKFSHYICNDDYSKYIIDIFFDSSIQVFNLLNYLSLFLNLKSNFNLIFQILNDNRLNQFINNYKNKKKILRIKIDTIISIAKNIDYDWDKQFQIVDKIQLNENQKLFLKIFKSILKEYSSEILIKKPFQYSSKRYDYEIINVNRELSINDNVVGTITTTTTTDPSLPLPPMNFQFNLDNVLLSKIIDLIIYNKYFNNNNYNDNNNDNYFTPIKININLSLINKQWFKVFRKIINRYPIQWFNKINLSFSLLNEPPLFIDYESIRYLEWNNISDQFSRVEELRIDCDIQQTKETKLSRDYINGTNLNSFNSCYTERNYLIYPPRMVNLKRLIISNYIGYNNISSAGYHIGTAYQIINYNDLINHLAINGNYNYDEINNGSTLSSSSLEFICIKFSKESPITPFWYEFSFLKTLLDYHSKTLKTIQIQFYFSSHRLIGIMDFNSLFLPFNAFSSYFSNYPNINFEFIIMDTQNLLHTQLKIPNEFHNIFIDKKRILLTNNDFNLNNIKIFI
ncbi:hypothetical protein DDB_G0275247 [Dictyostelium discoideum AX4]|uniref:Uncharacterized protein n=1 Tax=Dictyostelium discoideum TaxID=44689 RepID=Q554H3_DICDI|nr:hypothetical protein DDB_G0275247 [Dictyostelium discoideum AX4]EAL69904.1 hypothetical protein DDB_G0275247 [Dictyostelium discoideum AX4]|eukprot:XP_643738.1 hypothetical protein DDB_G0275247 [Dictyostelium discoideum AX4]